MENKRMVESTGYYFLLLGFVIGVVFLVSGIVLMYQNGDPETRLTLVIMGVILSVACPLMWLRTSITVVEVAFGSIRIENIYRAHTPFEYSESNWIDSSEITAIDIEEKRVSDIGFDDDVGGHRDKYNYHVMLKTKDDRSRNLKQFSSRRGAEKMKRLLDSQLGLRHRQ